MRFFVRVFAAAIFLHAIWPVTPTGLGLVKGVQSIVSTAFEWFTMHSFKPAAIAQAERAVSKQVTLLFRRCLIHNSECRLEQVQVMRKERAVGVVPQVPTVYEVLEELAITVQHQMVDARIPFCAFNGAPRIGAAAHQSLSEHRAKVENIGNGVCLSTWGAGSCWVDASVSHMAPFCAP